MKMVVLLLNVRLGGGGESLFSKVTLKILVNRWRFYMLNKITNSKWSMERSQDIIKLNVVISVATIQNALGKNFQITGLSNQKKSRTFSIIITCWCIACAITLLKNVKLVQA